MKKSVALLMIVVTFMSCKKTDSASTTTGTDFKIGTAWVYKYTSYNAAGAVVSTANITLTITSQQTLLGETWWVATGAGTPSYMRKTTTGYYTIRNGVSQLDFKVPAAVNDTWRKTYSSTAGDYSDFKVVSINQNVTVPKGTIACYYAEGYDSNSLEDKAWYNDANMMVKQEEYDQTATGALYVNFSLELVSFTP